MSVVRAALHAATHRHLVMTRGHEEVVLCNWRRGWGWVVRLGWARALWVHYRPHQHAPFVRLTGDEFIAVSSGRPWTYDADAPDDGNEEDDDEEDR